MGQKFTKQVVGRLEKGMQRYRSEMDKDIQRTILEKKRQAKGGYTDPNAMDGGFQRGMGLSIRQDEEQEAFLKSQQRGRGNEELSPDLIKFLQDLGPIQRKKTTGPRVRKRQLEEQEHLEEQERKPLKDGREIRQMPIMQETTFMTARTTNFSRKTEEEDPFGLTGRKLFQLLQDGNVACAAQVETANEKEKQEYSDLLYNSVKYLQVPIIMKDTDDTYVGTWPESVADMKLAKLTVVPESQVRILLAVEDPDEQKASKT
jgi:hypothetical protein